MKKRWMSLLLCGTMAATLLAGCGGSSSSAASSAAGGSSSADSQTASGSSPAAAAGSISIGTAFNTTGALAAYDLPASNGFQLAVDEINAAGGINGMQISYNTINAQSDAAQNATAVTRLIDVNGAMVLAGSCESTTAMNAGTAAQEAGVAYITCGATLPDLPDRVGDGFFLSPYGDNVQAYALADYAYNELGCKTAYVIEDTTSEYTTALSLYFKERFVENGGEIVLEDTYDENGYTDFSAAIEKVLALETAPDCLFFSSFTDQAPTMLQQFRARGLDQPVLSGDGFDSTTISEIAGDDANNVYYSTHVNLENDSEIVTNFNAAYEAAYGVAPENAFAALGYDTMYMIKYAIENYIDGDVTAASIKEALGQVSGFEGVTGTISYENGSHVPTKSVTLNKFENGEVVYVATV